MSSMTGGKDSTVFPLNIHLFLPDLIKLEGDNLSKTKPQATHLNSLQ